MTSIRVKLIASTFVSSSEKVACRSRDIQFKSEGHHTTADRSKPVQLFPRQSWGDIVYGRTGDTWESYTINADYLTLLKLQLDMIVDAPFRNGTAQCGIACAQVSVEHMPGPTADERVVNLLPSSAEHEWAYKAASSATYFPDGDWHSISFDDSTWTRANGDFGRKNSKAATKIHTDEHVIFFRTSFDVEKPECYRALQLSATLIQGGRIYLNGVLLWLHNVDPNALAESVTNEYANQEPKSKNGDDPLTVAIPETVLLLKGKNVVAVDVHELGTSDAQYELLFNLIINAIDTCDPVATMMSTKKPKTTTNIIGSGIDAPDGDRVGGGLSSLAVASMIISLLFCVIGLAAYYLTVVRKRAVLKA